MSKLLFILAFMFQFSAQAIELSEGDKVKALRFIESAVRQQSEQTLSELSSDVEKVIHFKVKNEASITFLTCALGSAGLLIKKSIGLCVDANKNIYNLKNESVGLVAGAKASLLIGFTYSPKQELRSTYKFWSNEILNMTLGADFIIAKSEQKDWLFLTGPSFGYIFDFTLNSLSIE